jgi:assimilatory nitrate reductase catalytic subunit
VTELARRLGRGQYFPYASALDVWNELRQASRGGVSDYSGITWEKIDAQDGVFWPCPSDDHPGTPRLFTERFGHADGRARFSAISYMPPAEEPGGDFPFRLTTGRVVYHYLSGNQTRRLDFLNSQAPEPWVEIHPQAAGPLGIQNDDLVRVRTPRGSMELKALVAPTLRPDTLFIPFHYGNQQAVNRLTNPAVEPTVKIPEYKVSAAAIERLDEAGRALGEGPLVNFTSATHREMFPYDSHERRETEEHTAKEF